MATKAKCGRCSGRRELVQAPHRGQGWAICVACLATLTSLVAERDRDEPKLA
jgi:hypothetical protein